MRSYCLSKKSARNAFFGSTSIGSYSRILFGRCLLLCSYRLLYAPSSSGSAESRSCSPFVAGLSVSLITGNSRKDGPPRPILGPRVTSYIQSQLERRGNVVTVLDPIELDLPLLEKPCFAYSKSQAPDNLKQLQDILHASEAYVAITPEYNHAPSPALLNLLNHFGSSTFSFKPSAIVSYSAGQWGGTRAAIALRPILSELGCLPVSSMIHIPKAQSVIREDGTLQNPEEMDEWNSYIDRTFSQLEWWGEAAKNHRIQKDPFETSPAFQSSPSQRNAPS